MKGEKLRLFLFIGMLSIGLTAAYGQGLKLEGQKLIYNETSYGVKEASSIFEQNSLCQQHYDLYLRMHKRKNFWRNTGLVLLGAGVTIHALTSEQGGDKQVFHERLGRALPLILFGGVGSILVLNSTIRPKAHLTDAIDCFNGSIEQRDHSYHLQLSSSGNGLWLVYSF